MISAWYGTLNTEDPANPFFKKIYWLCAANRTLHNGRQQKISHLHEHWQWGSLTTYLFIKENSSKLKIIQAWACRVWGAWVAGGRLGWRRLEVLKTSRWFPCKFQRRNPWWWVLLIFGKNEWWFEIKKKKKKIFFFFIPITKVAVSMYLSFF